MAEERPSPGGQGAATPEAGGDPSMEDILASIRRILNEDEQPAAQSPAAGPPATAAPKETEPEAEEEPLSLTEDMLVSAPVPAAAPEPLPAPVPVQVPAPSPPTVPVREVAPTPEPASDGGGLLAPAAAAAATASMGQLLRAVAAERSSLVTRGGPTIEDVVREEMRPLLKDWLDRHLPALVERLVRSEIERVVSRALS